MLGSNAFIFTLLLSPLSQAALLPYKRYLNTTVAGVSVDAESQSTIVNDDYLAGPVAQHSTTTMRVTVTFNPVPGTSATIFPSSVLFNPKVMVVAAPVQSTTAALLDSTQPLVSTVYLPTTIFVTAPCTATAVFANSPSSATTQTQFLTSLSFMQPGASSRGSDSIDAQMALPTSAQGTATLSAVASKLALVGNVFTNSTTSIAESPITLAFASQPETIHVIQTLKSTTTLFLPSPVATSI